MEFGEDRNKTLPVVLGAGEEFKMSMVVRGEGGGFNFMQE